METHRRLWSKEITDAGSKAGNVHLCGKQRRKCIGGKQNGDREVVAMVQMAG